MSTALHEGIRMGAFVGFVLLGLAAAVPSRFAGLDQRRRVDTLLAYVLLATTVVGLSQRESWPFSHWGLVHNLSPRRVSGVYEVELLQSGRSYAADPRLWHPIAFEELQSWLGLYFRSLSLAEQHAVAQFMLERAEAARQRLLRGEAIDPNGWLLGRLAAPYHFVRPRVWRSTADVPDRPFDAVRIWEVAWDVEARREDPGRVERWMVLEHDVRHGR